jgi:DNA-binding LacI/PurR family transcriptional regulator
LRAETREAVLRAAEELGYTRNSAARNLRLGRAHTLAYVVRDVTRAYYAYTLVGAEGAARARDYAMVLINTGGLATWSSAVETGLRAGTFDGVLLHHSDPDQESFTRSFKGRTVTIGTELDGVPAVEEDHEGAAKMLVEHLKGYGHSRIAYLGSPGDLPHKRLAILRQRALAAGLTMVAVEPAQAWTVEQSRLAAHSILARRPRPTAVVCHNEQLAPGVYKAARDLGLSIPEDVSVVTFGDYVISQALTPELTTIAIRNEVMGATATEALIRLIEGSDRPTVPILAPFELRIRGSSGVAPSL